jgi:sugar phosphate isomerase/epimerase
MKSAITVCLVPQACSGPFVYHDGLADACQRAAKLGFDAIEVFPSSAADINTDELRDLLDKYSLQLAAVGTGAGWVVQQLSLTATDGATAARAIEFIQAIIDLAGSFGAPAIIGSMQGRIPSPELREPLMQQLANAIEQLSERAARHGTPLLIEPLNRYETNVFTSLKTTADWLRTLKTRNTRILADMFHMNIEEADMAASIRQHADLIGHVHFADSNRSAVGLGHTDARGVVSALQASGYVGYLSAEVFPLPSADEAATHTIRSFKALAN